MADFKKLHVWRKAHALVLNVHRVASHIRGTQYGPLRNQILRAAMSIPTNIVEGRRQETEKQFCRFLSYAINSGCELEYHLILARDFRAIGEDDFRSLLMQVIEVRRMLFGLMNRLGGGEPQKPRGPTPRVPSGAAPSGEQ
jgi:four helix bundle protein